VDAERVQGIVVAEQSLSRRSPSESSRRRRHEPISIAGIGPTKPDAGRDRDQPATAPEIAPSALGRPRVDPFGGEPADRRRRGGESASRRTRWCARPFEASALAALNPNQPTHSRHAPMKLSTRLCGGIGSFG
jgi:hypothetical protein